MTYEHLIPLNFQKTPWISYTEDFLARILVWRVWAKAWRESEADWYSRSFAWPKKSSPIGYFLKTCQPSPHEGDFESLEKLPKWGMIVDGVLYPLHPLERYTGEKGGSFLPTPQACDATKGPAKKYVENGEQSSMRNLVTLSYRIWKAGVLSPEVLEMMMLYPTGWTELEPWAMQWFRSKRKRHSKS
jgi:hypothetical protein